jgi:hypothetical protein
MFPLEIRVFSHRLLEGGELGLPALLVSHERSFKIADLFRAFSVFLFESIQQRYRVGMAFAKPLEEVCVLLGMVETFREGIDVVDHRTEYFEVGLGPTPNIPDEVKHPVDDCVQRAVFDENVRACLHRFSVGSYVPWNRETGDGFLSGINIAGQDGASAEGILIVYPGGGNVTRIRAMAAELELPALAVFLVSITLGAIVLRLGLRRQIRAYEQIDGAVANFERSAWRVAAGGRELDVMADAAELRQLLDAAETRYRAVGRGLARVDLG